MAFSRDSESRTERSKTLRADWPEGDLEIRCDTLLLGGLRFRGCGKQEGIILEVEAVRVVAMGDSDLLDGVELAWAVFQEPANLPFCPLAVGQCFDV